MSVYSAARSRRKERKVSLDEQIELDTLDVFDEDEELEDEAAESAAFKWVDYICLPNALAKEPYLAVASGVFTFEVLGACLQLARGEGPYGKARHDKAFASGRASIGLHRGHVVKRDVDVKEKTKHRSAYKKLVRKGFRNKGKLGYARARESFVLKDPLKLPVSRAALLRAAGISDNQAKKGKHVVKLDEALERLCQPIVKGLPPLIEDYSVLKDGRLYLQLHEAWFPSLNFATVFWPPPKGGRGGGATVLALYLFLFGCDHNNSDRYIPLPKLYQRLGLTGMRPAHAYRKLERALKLVNKHLAKSAAALRAHNLHGTGGYDHRRLPEQFEMNRLRRGVQFRAVYDEGDAYQEAAE